MRIAKYLHEGSSNPRWGIISEDSLKPIRGITDIGELFSAVAGKKIETDVEISLSEARLLPPADTRSNIFCAGLNYLDHAEELKMPVPRSPIFFCKPSGALAGPVDDILYPEATGLLDYEVELACIVGRTIGCGDKVTPENLSQYILGIAILNDISARDIQLRSGQWFLGKCFRTFAPMGPCIQVLDKSSEALLYNLTLSLQVYDKEGAPCSQKKQMGNTRNMIFQIHDLINSLREKFPLQSGDIISTGTPCGVALSRPNPLKARLAEIIGIPVSKRIEMFLESEKKGNDKYLQPGETVRAEIYSEDRVVDLGRQQNMVIAAKESGQI